MTQRQQVRMHTTIREALQSYTYVPGKPADREEAQMLHRIAVRAVALAEEYGEVLTHKDALQRVRCNLRDVRAMGVKS